MNKAFSLLMLVIVLCGLQAQAQTAPSVISINRQSPTSSITNLSGVTFRVTFSTKVTGVDRTDFIVVAVSGNVTGTVYNKSISAVGTTGAIYDVKVNSISGNGILRLDLKSSGTGIKDVNGVLISGGFTTGQTYTIDKIAPKVISINRQFPLTATTSANTLVYRVTFSEKVRRVNSTDFTLTRVSGTVSGTITTNAVVATSTDSVSYDVKVTSVTGNGTLRLDLKSKNTGIIDVAGNAISGGFTSGQTYTIDGSKPVLSSVSIASNNTNTSFAKVGSLVTLSFTASETINPVVTIATHAVTSTAGSNNTYTASYIMTSSDAETIVPFTINFTDLTGNAGTQVTTTTNGSKVQFDKTAPSVVNIQRQLPTADTISDTSVIFRAVFSEAVTGVDKTDFALTTTGVNANIASVTKINGSTYDVSVSSITGNGNLRLDLKSSSTGINDSAGNAITTGFTSGESYVLRSTASYATSLNFVPVTATTGEKPQSKVWNYNNTYWTVLANSTGTYIWRLDGTSWTNVLKISDSTNSQADCKVAGSVTHILLYQGMSSHLVSVEYVSGSNTYQLWSTRNSTVSITLDSGVETAVIDIDTLGRMWLASAGVNEINVRWSDAPYSSWSAPITIFSGVADDDICDVINMPKDGKVGVLWSNQKTKRFGFKTHVDGTDPSIWSVDEVPASQSALNIKGGMADDHLHMVAASDGTLYCAVKTSYDSTGFPKIALLVRRPNGVWDSLYKVSETGTRGIVILNEDLAKLKVIYTSQEDGGDILYRETSIPTIHFGPVVTMIPGSYNDATSMKTNYSPDDVILASTPSRAVGALLTDLSSTSIPTIPILSSPLNGKTAIAPTTLKWNAAAGATSYQLQVSTLPDFSTTVSDQSGVTSTSMQLNNLISSTSYYWRVKAFNTIGSSDWSTIWSFTTSSGGPLMAEWKMDEGSGTTLIDASEYQNNATIVGSPVWVPGKIAQALHLDGATQYAVAPNSESLDITNGITICTWIKPEKLATQYLIKKASLDVTDGYELSLSSNGQIFFRINQFTSQDVYRVSSVSRYTANGNIWVHLAATFDGTVLKLYVNGVLDSSVTLSSPVTISSNTLDVGIGAGPNGGTKFQGAMDDARIYNTALSATEIFNIATSIPPTAPVLVKPTNTTIAVPVNPVLKWNQVSSNSPTSFQVQVSTVSDFSATVFDQSNIADTSVQVNGLANTTVYYWRVKASNSVGSSDWSATWSFTTASSNPLVAQWNMDEGSGTTLIDASAYQNNATTVGNPAWVAGKIGQALQLDGNSQYATAQSNGSLDLSNAITITAWVKPEKTATQYIIKKASLDVTDGYELGLSSTGQAFFRINQFTSQDIYKVTSVAHYPTNGTTWMHVAATFDGSALKLYINGVLDNTVTLGSPVIINSNGLAVGIGAGSNGGSKFQGAIDDARIYNSALSESEIANIAASVPPPTPVLAVPANGTIAVALTPTLRWNNATSGIPSSYQVQVSGASDFASLIFDQSNIQDTTVQVAGLSNSTVYYWRVRAINNIGNSDWSTIWSFTTLSSNPLIAQWKMDEGSGSTLLDVSSYQNNATTTGSPIWVTGRIGQALQLDGSTQYARASDNGSLNPAAAITLAAWIKPEQKATQNVIKKAANDATDGYELSLGSDGSIFFRINQKTSANTYRVTSSVSYPTDGTTWMHIAATYDGTVMKLYINGIENASLSPANPPLIATNTLMLAIGAQPDGLSKFKGAIDDARIYNTALTASDIFNIVAEASPTIPVLVAPSNGAGSLAVNPTLIWRKVASANSPSYEVQVSTASDFSSTVLDQTGITDTTVQVNGLINNTTYYWRVKATNNAGNSDWSNVWSFTTVSNSPLVAWWKMDEGSGTTLIDASDYHNNATTQGNPVWVTGQIGQGLQLDGTTQSAKAVNSTSLNPTNAITLAAWVRPQQTATQNIIKKAVNGSIDGYELSLSSAGKVFLRINQFTSADNFRVTSSASYPVDGTWMHIAATYDGVILKVYINGNLDNSFTPVTSTTINSNTLSVGIGAQSDGLSKFKGAIDDARIYNTALSASEIANLATIPPPLIASSSSTAIRQSNYKEELLALPNPFSTKTTIRFTVSENGPYSVRLYDMSGKQISVVKEGTGVAGETNVVDISGLKLARGIFILKLQTRRDTKTIKLLHIE